MAIEFPANKFVGDTFPYQGMTYVWDGEKWTASGAAAFEDAYVNKDGDTMTGDLTVPNLISEGDVQTSSINGGPLAGLRNQIINGSFEIAQRSTDGTSSDPKTGYLTADRWFHNGSGTAVGRIVRDTALSSIGAPPGFDYTLHFVDSSKTNRGGFAQPIELPLVGNPGPFVPGSQWTLSFWVNIDASSKGVENLTFADNAIGDNSVTCSAGSGLSYTEIDTAPNNWKRYSVTYTINNTAPAATNAALRVNLGTVTQNGKLAITGVQFEPGPVATPIEIRPYGLELSLCQRYFWKVERIRGMMRWHGYDNSTYADPVLVPFPVEMRAYPTRSAITGTAVNDTGGALTNFQWGSNNGGKDKIYIHVQKTDGSQPAAGTYTRIEGATFTLDAEL